MEYVNVNFPTRRRVYIDEEENGYTNQVLRVDAGTHCSASAVQFPAASRKLTVKDTTASKPLRIGFRRKKKEIRTWRALLLAACATVAPNPPLARYQPQAGYRFRQSRARPRIRMNLRILTFSGGGTRAAALAYGVLEALRDTTHRVARAAHRRSSTRWT